MLYQIQNGTLSFGDKVVLSHVDMEIKGKEKIGIVGPNGTGKSSLLKVMAGQLVLDRDDKRTGKGIVCSRQLKIAALSQDHSRWLDQTVEEILLEGFYETTDAGKKQHTGEEKVVLDYSAERFFYEQKYDRLLRSFGFQPADKSRKLCGFSGGEQTKLMLVRLLLSDSDILLLDEPTNHLDGESLEALEAYVKDYPGAVVMVSHDRYFLDRCAEIIYELEDGHLTRYAGNYSAYRTEKRKRYDRQLKAWERQQEEIEKNEQLIRQFKNKPRKAAFARSRKTMLSRMERLEKPKLNMGHMFTGELKPEFPGPKWMLETKELQIGFEKGEILLDKLDLRIKRGQKIGVIGKNGIGKSTLLKTLTGQITPLKGSFRFGEKVISGYFDQISGQTDREETVAEYFHHQFPAMPEKEMYGKLAAFLFRGSICHQKISTLSGGEKARLRLCELLTICPNFLILDEPTNHMDIPAKETLESAFRAYTGTMLIVSHDRYFLDQVVDAILVLEEGKAYYYPFGYTHYRESRQRMTRLMEKGVSLDDLPGMLSAQDQAMVASLKAVPKAARMQSRALSDEEAYADWRLHLAGEPLEKARRLAEEKAAALQAAQAELSERVLQMPGAELSVQEQQMLSEHGRQAAELYGAADEDFTQLRRRVQESTALYAEAEEAWTRACLEWYDVWLDTMN